MATFRSRQRANQRRDGKRDDARAPTDTNDSPVPADTPPATSRSRLIKPVEETSRPAAPPEPRRHAPNQRRGLPVTETKPTERRDGKRDDARTPIDTNDSPVPTGTPPAPSRRRLIKPVEESPRSAAPAPEPRRHAPSQRRGLPATETKPTERPAFERRDASSRRSGQTVEALALFAVCPRGLETVLQQELLRLGAGDVAPTDGGVACSGTPAMLMRINLESRVASRVLLRLAQGTYRSERDINALAMQVDWPAHFDVTRTIKVKTDGAGSRVKSLEYVSLTVKDAVCDRFRQAQLGRPNVDTRAPDVRIQVFLGPSDASIYLDSSGDALFKRGWRKESGEAPLRENLAAGILLLAGYDGSQPLLDPMCGSGTFLVEAADIALKRAPGRERAFAFEKWKTFDAAEWQQLKAAARAAERPAAALPIRGSDQDSRMVAMARANLERAGLDGMVDVEVKDVFDTRPHASTGLIVTNPPYGVRLDELDRLAALYPQLGDWLKRYFSGWTAQLFTGDLRLPKLIRLSVKRRIPLFNGALDCRLFTLPLVAGSAREN